MSAARSRGSVGQGATSLLVPELAADDEQSASARDVEAAAAEAKWREGHATALDEAVEDALSGID